MLKNAFLLFLCVSCLSCSGSSNNITEVGNPSNTTTIAKGTTQALVNTLEGLVGSVNENQALIKKLGSIENFKSPMVETEDAYDCVFNEGDETSLTCDCPGGGTITESFDSNVTEEAGFVSLEGDLVITFDACVADSCGEEVSLMGTINGVLNARIDTLTGASEISVVFSTENACSGLSSADSNVGLEFNASFVDGAEDSFSGTYCQDEDSVSFESFEEFEEEIDPDATCAEE